MRFYIYSFKCDINITNSDISDQYSIL